MYPTDTVLSLKVQRDADEETGEEFPYNEVRVVGPSPVSHSHKGDWEGADAAGVIIVPLSNFGATLDEPYGKLVKLYDVESIPSDDIPISAPKVAASSLPRTVLGPTPEDVFKDEAPGVAPEEGEKRGRTPFTDSPLTDPGPTVSDPLGDL